MQDLNNDLNISIKRLDDLQRLLERIGECKNREEIWAIILEVIPQIASCVGCAVFICQKGELLKLKESIYENGGMIDPVEKEMLQWVCKRGQVMLLPEEEGERGRAIVPLVWKESLMGALILNMGEQECLHYSEAHRFSLTTLANHTARVLFYLNSLDEKKKQVREEREKRSYLEGVISSIHYPVVSIDSSGVIRVFNKKAEELLEISARIALGNRYSVVMPQMFQSFFSECFETIRSHQGVKSVPFSFLSPTNQKKSARIEVSALKEGKITKLGMICVFFEKND